VACKGFDEQLVRHDPKVRDLLEQFVRVRVVHANGMDLSLFQFDYDLTFAAFFLNADRTIYGRFGTRSTHDEASRDITLDGFRAALTGALELHRGYPQNKPALAGKQGQPSAYAVPEDFPSLKGKYNAWLDYDGNVVRSCIHCHQVREAQRLIYRTNAQPLPDEVLHPWPMPDVLGLSLDPNTRATVKAVTPGSVADRAGFKAGDELRLLEGQPLLSLADVQWAMQTAVEPTVLHARVRRGDSDLELALPLAKEWRRPSDISWRPTTWDLRRMVTGGLRMASLTAEERKEAGVRPDEVGLRVLHAGEYGEHATAKNAGVRKGDVVVGWEGLKGPLSESDVISEMLRTRMPGREIEVEVLRGGERQRLRFKLR